MLEDDPVRVKEFWRLLDRVGRECGSGKGWEDDWTGKIKRGSGDAKQELELGLKMEGGLHTQGIVTYLEPMTLLVDGPVKEGTRAPDQQAQQVQQAQQLQQPQQSQPQQYQLKDFEKDKQKPKRKTTQPLYTPPSRRNIVDKSVNGRGEEEDKADTALEPGPSTQLASASNGSLASVWAPASMASSSGVSDIRMSSNRSATILEPHNRGPSPSPSKSPGRQHAPPTSPITSMSSTFAGSAAPIPAIDNDTLTHNFSPNTSNLTSSSESRYRNQNSKGVNDEVVIARVVTMSSGKDDAPTGRRAGYFDGVVASTSPAKDLANDLTIGSTTDEPASTSSKALASLPKTPAIETLVGGEGRSSKIYGVGDGKRGSSDDSKVLPIINILGMSSGKNPLLGSVVEDTVPGALVIGKKSKKVTSLKLNSPISLSSNSLPDWVDPAKVLQGPNILPSLLAYLSKNSIPSHLPLPYNATLFFSDTSTTKTKFTSHSSYKATYKPIFTAETLPQFMGAYLAAKSPRAGLRPTLMAPNQNLFLMRRGVEPEWEDPINKRGGRITITPPRNMLDEIWEACVFAFVGGLFLEGTLGEPIPATPATPLSGGGTFWEGAPSTPGGPIPDAGEDGVVVGVVISRRARGDRVEVWCDARGAEWSGSVRCVFFLLRLHRCDWLFLFERIFDVRAFCDFRKKLAAELPPDLPPMAREIVLTSKYKRHFDK